MRHISALGIADNSDARNASERADGAREFGGMNQKIHVVANIGGRKSFIVSQNAGAHRLPFERLKKRFKKLAERHSRRLQRQRRNFLHLAPLKIIYLRSEKSPLFA
jgi:hypothetical protein